MSIKIFVFGNGNWSKNHQKILSAMNDVSIHAFDIDTTPDQIFARYGRPDAALVTASTVNHHVLTQFFLSKNIPVFCEKPICLEWWQLSDLKNYISQKPIFMAGHQLVFDPLIDRISKEGNASFFSSKRTGAIPRTEGAVMSLAVHDIAIAMHIFGYKFPERIEANGNQHSAQISITWPTGQIADIFVQSISTIKLRHATIVQESELTSPTIHYLNPDCWNRLNLLEMELNHFITCIRLGDYPKYNNLEKALAVTEVTMMARDTLRKA